MPQTVNVRSAPIARARYPVAGYVNSQKACVIAKSAAYARPRSSTEVCSATSVAEGISIRACAAPFAIQSTPKTNIGGLKIPGSNPIRKQG